jgi:hypothetical protein
MSLSYHLLLRNLALMKHFSYPLTYDGKLNFTYTDWFGALFFEEIQPGKLLLQ